MLAWAQVIYTSSPDPLLLERFDPLAVTFQLTAAPQHGKLTVAGQTSPVAAGTACAAPTQLYLYCTMWEACVSRSRSHMPLARGLAAVSSMNRCLT